MNNYGYVYKYTLIPTGKIYIGQHRSNVFDENYWGSGTTWMRVIKQYKHSDIKREILEWADSCNDLNEKETFWIRKLNSMDENIGYNRIDKYCTAFFTNHHHSDETKLKISKSSSGKNNPMYGIPCYINMSDDEKNNWKYNLMIADPRRKVILCKETNEIFNSIREASRKLNLNHTRIMRALKNNKTICGYTFIIVEGEVIND